MSPQTADQTPTGQECCIGKSHRCGGACDEQRAADGGLEAIRDRVKEILKHLGRSELLLPCHTLNTVPLNHWSPGY